MKVVPVPMLISLLLSLLASRLEFEIVEMSLNEGIVYVMDVG